jgi:hypothetical protein
MWMLLFAFVAGAARFVVECGAAMHHHWTRGDGARA